MTTIFTQEKTIYILGFLWGDGHLVKPGRSVSLEIQVADGVELKPVLGSSGKWRSRIRSRNRYGVKMKDSMGFFCNDKDFYELLLSCSYDQKSFVSPTKILALIPSDLRYLFWRGFFDADGCVTFSKTFNQGRITFTGHIHQDWKDLVNMLDSLGIKSTKVVYSGKTQYSMIRVLTPKRIQTLYNYLYQGARKIGLRRKLIKMEILLNEKVKGFA